MSDTNTLRWKFDSHAVQLVLASNYFHLSSFLLSPVAARSNGSLSVSLNWTVFSADGEERRRHDGERRWTTIEKQEGRVQSQPSRLFTSSMEQTRGKVTRRFNVNFQPVIFYSGTRWKNGRNLEIFTVSLSKVGHALQPLELWKFVQRKLGCRSVAREFYGNASMLW